MKTFGAVRAVKSPAAKAAICHASNVDGCEDDAVQQMRTEPVGDITSSSVEWNRRGGNAAPKHDQGGLRNFSKHFGQLIVLGI
jgi:hypothetical protein